MGLSLDARVATVGHVGGRCLAAVAGRSGDRGDAPSPERSSLALPQAGAKVQNKKPGDEPGFVT